MRYPTQVSHQTEEWISIVSNPHYQVSSLGRVKSLSRILVRANHRQLTIRERILKPRMGRNGYLNVGLDRIIQKRGGIAIHRLVAEAFLPNPLFLPCVNHKNSNKLDNSISNLEWVTYSENALHAKTNGKLSHLHIKLTDEDVLAILALKKRISSYVLAKKYQVNASTIQRIWNNRSHCDVLRS